ncbi:MAG TPA: lytic transglycosylase domain-containing protein [Thermoanaerobaculia bacterium]|nr:lytic transglycosylase domain-containing protein [Thermoanaerobaculia bacterium]
MAELKTSRPYEERFLEGFDRSQLRMEVQKVKPKGMRRMKRRYATWALGASLAIGGLGAPIKMIQNTNANSARQTAGERSLDEAIAGDVETAQSIASQVAGGVAAGVVGAAGSVGDAASSSLKTVAEAPARLALITESAREQFFRTEVPFGSIIYREAKKNDLRPELVAAMIQQESRFKPTARSPVGAVGLMQLVPKTGRWMGARDLTNPTQNIQAGTKYLKYLNERFDGNETIVIAAYNAGEGNVRRFGGVPPFKETQNYLKKVRTYEKEFASRVQSHLADATMGVAEAR